MKERFKRFLEREFRAIRPTQAAMEYRQQMLTKLMDRAQELRIKGIQDDDLVYDMCIDELGDFRETLIAFEQREHKVKDAKRNAVLAVVVIVGAILALVIAYLITSFATGAWGTTWLIMVGGIFAGVIASAGYFIYLFGKKRKYWGVRGCAAVITVLISVFMFLLLQILFGVDKSWLAFLVMIILLFAVDTVLAFVVNSKVRLIESCIFVEIACVMIFVIVGIVTTGLWHPLWVLCLGGVVYSIVLAAAMLARRNRKANAVEGEKIESKYVAEDEKYYTMWKD